VRISWVPRRVEANLAHPSAPYYFAGVCFMVGLSNCIAKLYWGNPTSGAMIVGIAFMALGAGSAVAILATRRRARRRALAAASAECWLGSQ
jgi:hypothetical protein